MHLRSKKKYGPENTAIQFRPIKMKLLSLHVNDAKDLL